jgi:hypothetical protein
VARKKVIATQLDLGNTLLDADSRARLQVSARRPDSVAAEVSTHGQHIAAYYAGFEDQRHAAEVNYVVGLEAPRRTTYLLGVAEKRGEAAADRLANDAYRADAQAAADWRAQRTAAKAATQNNTGEDAASGFGDDEHAAMEAALRA